VKNGPNKNVHNYKEPDKAQTPQAVIGVIVAVIAGIIQ